MYSQKAGDRVEELVDNVGRFAAIEDLLHERLDNQGNPTTRETRKFDYAAYITQPRTGVLLVDEFRTERYGIDNLPDQIATSGFPALALVFHPSMQGDYEITCEGLGQWKGRRLGSCTSAHVKTAPVTCRITWSARIPTRYD